MPEVSRLIKRFIIGIIAVCALAAVGLAATRIILEIRFPEEAAAPSAKPAPGTTGANTVLNIPLSVSSNDLRQALAEYVPETYQDTEEDFTDLLIEDEITYDLKRGPIDIAITENGFDFSFRVTGVVRARGRINLALAEIPASSHADVAGRISGRIGLKILPDWQVALDLNARVDMQKALIPVENFGNISIRTFLEKKLTRKIKKARHKLASKILAKDRVRKKVTRAWEKMHRVEQVKDFPRVWVRVVPQAVGLMPPAAGDDKSLHLGLRLVLKTDAGISGTLPAAPVTLLPDAKILDKVSNRFAIRVPFAIETGEVNAYLAKEAAGRILNPAAGLTVTVDRAQVLSFADDRLTAIVFADCRYAPLGLESAARLYLTGRVAYDAPAATIRLVDVTYDASFSRWWAGLAHWTAAPYVRHQARTRLVYSLERQIQKADEAIRELIAELTVPPGIQAALSVKTPKMGRLGANHYGLYGALELDGSLAAALDFSETGENGPEKED